MAKKNETEQVEAIRALREMGLRPGSTIYTQVTHVARSGMSRTIECFVVVDGGIVNISGYVAHAIGESRDHKRGGLRVSGCGMDMCWHTVYRIGRALFPQGGPLSKSPRKHQEKRPGKTREFDGGYLLVNRGL